LGKVSPKHWQINLMSPSAPFCQDAATISPPSSPNEEGAGEESEAAGCETPPPGGEGESNPASIQHTALPSPHLTHQTSRRSHHRWRVPIPARRSPLIRGPNLFCSGFLPPPRASGIGELRPGRGHAAENLLRPASPLTSYASQNAAKFPTRVAPNTSASGPALL
jgi:hypothetical protein